MMKAISPVRSVRSCYAAAVCCISEQSLAITRNNKPSAMEETVSALCDMNDCYSKLKELVPSIPQNKTVSQVEILQHVIDYIWDLQVELDEPEKSRQSGGLPRTPLTTLNAELASISVEVNIVLSFGPLWVGGGDSPLFNFA